MTHRLLVLLAFLVIAGPLRAQGASPACAAPDDASGTPGALPHVAAALKPQGHLTVLAVGSASLFGPEASLQPGSLGPQSARPASPSAVPPAERIRSPASPAAFPERMARALEAAVPGVAVAVDVEGGRGLTAADQLQLIEEALAKRHYDLVLWQTGTVEAVRNLPPGEFATTLTEGVGKAEQAGADTVLIDPQYSRFLQTNSNIEPYQQALDQLSAVPGVATFHRFELMRGWVSDGRMDLERTAKPDRRRAVEQLHACLGEQLARFLMAAARQ